MSKHSCSLCLQALTIIKYVTIRVFPKLIRRLIRTELLSKYIVQEQRTITKLNKKRRVDNHQSSAENSYYCSVRSEYECHPTYLGVTLDRTLSYREHLTKTAGKLKNRNNLLMKLAGSTWGASANTLRSSALALCYSAAQSTAPQSGHALLTQVGSMYS